MKRPSVLLFALILVVGAVAAEAETYTVTLTSGTTFVTRYQPREAAWDAAKITLLTEFGTPISLAKSDVASIRTETENRGFGRAIDATTVELGASANDAADPSAQGQAGGDPAAALVRAIQESQTQPPVYNQRQFVDPNQLTGIPITWTQTTTPPLSGVVVNTAPQPQPPR